MWFTALTATAIAALLIVHRKWVYILWKTLPRDLSVIPPFTRLNFCLWRYQKQNKTMAKVFQEVVAKYPTKVAFYFEEQKWSFLDVDEYSTKIANFFKQQGFQRGDTVALLLESRPEYVALWLGLSKIGSVTALINTNLVGDPLVHSVKVANSKAIIFGGSFAKVVRDVAGKFEFKKFYQFNEREEDSNLMEGAVNLRGEISATNGLLKSVDEDIAKGKSCERIIYVYTSGTTGLPKAAVITHTRFFTMTLGVHYMTGLTPDDILYDSLPLYHSAGGMLGVGQAILRGVSVVIRKKFSASNFWKDCAKYRCTAAQYIGEICRYLLATNIDCFVPHHVRLMFGNGLRPQIWNNFVDTFKIQQVFELYGATEGNTNLINVDNTPGAIGFVPRYAERLYPVILIRCDDLGEPVRNADGFCTRCQPGEVGVIVGKIKSEVVLNSYQGYADKAASEKKILRNVFKSGDMYFNSGDILVQDELGYYYFKDRTGDTFRWKGENVSTSEVEAVISNVTNLKDAVVYGVQIPGTEGRAGMAAIVDTDASLDLDNLCKHLRANLPGYAFPIFLRIMQTVPVTGTFKLKKRDLQQEGYDVNTVKDDLYFYNSKLNAFEKLTRNVYEDIVNGKIRL